MVFDAGGLNIKPTGSIEDMYTDKGIFLKKSKKKDNKKQNLSLISTL